MKVKCPRCGWLKNLSEGELSQCKGRNEWRSVKDFPAKTASKIAG